MREMTLLTMKGRNSFHHGHWHFYNKIIPYDFNRTEINHSTYLRKGLGLLENPSKSAYTMKGIRSEFIKDSAECFDHLKDCLNNLAREGKTLIFTKGGNELSWIADLKAR